MQHNLPAIDISPRERKQIVESINQLIINQLIPGSSNAREQAFYNFVHGFIQRAKDPYWNNFLSLLLIIFENKNKWEFAPPHAWSDDGIHVFSEGSEEIAKIFISDIRTVPDYFISSSTSTTSISIDGCPVNSLNERFKSTSSWRRTIVNAAQAIFDTHNLDPLGYFSGVSVPKERTSIVGYVLSSEGVGELTDGNYPEYFNDEPGFSWNGIVEYSSRMQIFLTATYAGNITHPHEDDPGVDSMIWHLFGIKLWLIWDASAENYQILLEKEGHNKASDLRWCLENLKGLKVR